MNINDEVIKDMIRGFVDLEMCPEQISLEHRYCISDCTKCWENAFKNVEIIESNKDQ